MSTINRRQVATGASWALPLIAVGSAAPAMAASLGCPSPPEATLVSQTNDSATIELDFPPFVGTYIFEILTVSGVSFQAPTTLTYPVVTSTLLLTLPRSNSSAGSGTVTVTYRLVVVGTLEVCLESAFTFPYTR